MPAFPPIPDLFPTRTQPLSALFPFPLLFWLNSLPEKACAVKGKNSCLNHTEPSKFLLGSLSLFARNNFFCGGLSLPFLPYPPFLDGSAFFRCFFGVRRKEFFPFRRLMLGFGRVSVWFWAEIGQDNVLTFLFFFCYDNYIKPRRSQFLWKTQSSTQGALLSTKIRSVLKLFSAKNSPTTTAIPSSVSLQTTMHRAGRQPHRPAKASQRYKFMLGNGHYSRAFTLFQRTPQIYRIYAKTELCRQTDHNRHQTKRGMKIRPAADIKSLWSVNRPHIGREKIERTDHYDNDRKQAICSPSFGQRGACLLFCAVRKN